MDTLDPSQPQGSSLNRFHETSAKLQRYRVLLRRRWWFLLLTAAIAVTYTVITITSKPQEYVAFGKIHVGTQIRVNGAGNQTLTDNFLSDFYGTQIELLQSSGIKSLARQRMATSYPNLKEIDVDVRVQQNKGSSILNVAGVGVEAEYTQHYLDALLAEYLAFRKSMIEKSIGGTVTKVIEQVVTKENAMKKSKQLLDEFLKKNDATMFEGNLNRAAAYVIQLENTLQIYETEIGILQRMELDNYLRQQDKRPGVIPAIEGRATSLRPDAMTLPTTPTSTVEEVPTSGGITSMEARYLDAQNELLFLEEKRESDLRTYRPEHPAILKIDDEITQMKSKISIYKKRCLEEMEGRKAGLQTKINGINDQLKKKRVEAADANEKIVMFRALDGEYKRLLEDWQDWKKKLEQLDATGITQSDLVAILDRPTYADKKDRELLLPITVALVLGLIAGSIILLLFDRLDDRMNTFSEFQSLFPNESILGQIPELSGRGDVSLIRPGDDRHLYAEAFRNLRSSILFKNWAGGKPPKVILVTSAVPNEGKTTSVANMAVTMALGGARVLLADADLRRGGVNELFGIQGTPGFSEVLGGQVHWRDAVLESGTRGLHVLPRGEAVDQASELFLSTLSDEVIREMTEEYDYIIFDSAPVLVADDTASFAPKVDTVLFVVRMSSTMARLSAKALDLLYDRQVHVGGVILNRASTSLKEYTYYNYASYYSVGAKKGGHIDVASS